MAELRLDGVSKRFAGQIAVANFDLLVEDGELVTLLGPSGSGKTTLLRLVAGYIAPDAGRVILGGSDITSAPPEKRNIGMVFQSYALFPHRNVHRNVAFGLERRRVAGPERDERVRAVLERVHLEGLEARLPRELSGGQQQRVALARALVIRPTLLLLDEPLSNLDAKLRAELRLEIRRLQRELGITTVLVTHDQEEALAVSDRIALLHRGRLQQIGTPDALYHHPDNRFVAEFVGKMNLLPVRRSGQGRYRLSTGEELSARDDENGPSVCLGVRPESIRIGARPDGSDASASAAVNSVHGKLVRRVFLGELVELAFLLGEGTELVVRGGERALSAAPVGGDVELWWDVEATRALSDELDGEV